jgi:hypothetical protein
MRALRRCEGRQSESEKIKKIMKTKTQNHQKKSNQTSSGLENRNDKINQEGKPSLPKIDLELRRNNRALPTAKVLEVLQGEAPTFWQQAEVVGKWIWIQFKEKQSREVTAVLSQLGFHWNNKRQAWQHPCGNFTQKPASYDPRERYGSAFPADSQTA